MRFRPIQKKSLLIESIHPLYNLTDDFFMETLVNNVRNDCVNYQIFVGRTIANTLTVSRTELNELKKNYEVNHAEIFEIEKKLDQIQDTKLRAKLECTRNFEIINKEKITPNFLNLSKGSKSDASLLDITDDNGNPFNSDAELKEYVRSFYANLYKAPETDRNFNDNCIHEFLGEEIVNSRLVQDCIIPAELRQELESPISVEELNISVAQGNKSASGMDGLSNCFIKKYWEFLRTPWHRYATFCHENGRLTYNFSTASIKLIPKKGDTSKLKNWRPISLLSCLYKVISRALNNRLKKATGYIFSRSQKGFTSDRHIQEVLMNVVEMIAHCKKK
jgi:hypothetical protein